MVEHIEQVHSTYNATISTHDMWRVIIRCRVTSPKKSIEELHHKIFLLSIPKSIFLFIGLYSQHNATPFEVVLAANSL